MPQPQALRVLLLPTLLIMLPAAAGGQSAGPPSPEEGHRLAAELGCGACHAGMPAADVARGRAPILGPEGTPLPAEFVFTYLADPQRRRQDIGDTRMPDFALDEGERLALSLFLGTGAAASQAVSRARARHPGVDAALGRLVFHRLGCAGCHGGLGTLPTTVGPDLSREGVRVRPEWLEAFLSTPAAVRPPGHPAAPGARMPDFRLDADEARALASFLASLGHRFAEADPTPLSPFAAGRARTLLEGRLACLGCHRVGENGGRIGPSLNGLASRLQPGFVLEMILDPARAAPGSPMPHQPLPEREARRLARYLLDLAGEAEGGSPQSLADPEHPAWTLADGEPPGSPPALYARHCAACHGTEGGGDGWNAAHLPVPPTAHADSALMARRADDTLFDGIHAGAWVLDGSPRMPPFGALLSPAEIQALVGHIRTLCSCRGPAWSGDGGRR